MLGQIIPRKREEASKMKCIICKSKEFELIANKVRDSDRHKVVKCNKCHLFQLFPLPSIKNEKKFYNEDKQSKNVLGSIDIEAIKRNSADDTMRRVNFVSRFISKDSTIIDIGSGYGLFIEEMNRRGFDIIGLEISKERREISRKITNVQVLDVNICESPLEIEKVECMTLHQVLEHIRDPIKFLKKLRMYMKENAKVIIEVPNVDDLMLESNKAYRDFYWQRAHLLYFSLNTLTQIVKKAGFSKYEVYFEQRYGIENFANWHIRNRPQIDKPSYHSNANYKWLEDFYKNYLIDSGRADTLIVIVTNG